MIRAEYKDVGATIETRVYFGDQFAFRYRPGTRHVETARESFESDMGEMLAGFFKDFLESFRSREEARTLSKEDPSRWDDEDDILSADYIPPWHRPNG